MNALLRALLISLVAGSLMVACSEKTEEAAADAKAEMGEAIDATKDAAAAAATSPTAHREAETAKAHRG